MFGKLDKDVELTSLVQQHLRYKDNENDVDKVESEKMDILLESIPSTRKKKHYESQRKSEQTYSIPEKGEGDNVEYKTDMERSFGYMM